MNKIHFHKPGLTTAIVTYIFTGSRSEPDDIKGISHFIEHMLFCGKNKERKKLLYQIEKYGGEINAYTGYDCVQYFMHVSNQYFDKCLPLYYELINDLTLSNIDLQKEKKIVFREIDSYKSSWTIYNKEMLFMKYLFLKNDGLRLPILGTKKSINKFNLRLLKKWYQKYYTDNNMLEVIVGNVDNYVHVCNKKTKTFSVNIRKLNGVKCIVQKMPVKEVYGILGGCSQLPNKTDFVSYFCLSIFLNSILNDMTGRLFCTVREKYGFVYYIDYTDFLFEDGLYKWSIETQFKSKNFGSIYMILLDLLRSLKNISNDELEYAYSKAIGKLDVLYENPLNIALNFEFVHDLVQWKEIIVFYKKNLYKFKKLFREYVSLIDFENVLLSCILPE